MSAPRKIASIGFAAFSVGVCLALCLAIALAVYAYSTQHRAGKSLTQRDFVTQLQLANVTSPVVITTLGDSAVRIHAPLKVPVSDQAYMEFETKELKPDWEQAFVTQGVEYKFQRENSFWTGLLINVAPLVVLVFLIGVPYVLGMSALWIYVRDNWAQKG